MRLPVAFNDMAAMDAGLISAGVQPLVNTAVQVPGADLWVAGVDDLTEGFPDLRAALAGVPDEPPVILLAHNPDIWLNARVAAADLVLSGHTHGGQVRLPGVGVAHTQGTHLSRQRPAGWFERDGTRMFVTRGLGESIPLRFGVRPQVASDPPDLQVVHFENGGVMKTILCYGDSNTWGYDPATEERYPLEVRWVSVLARELGSDYHVIPEGLNGRTTVWPDPGRANTKAARRTSSRAWNRTTRSTWW